MTDREKDLRMRMSMLMDSDLEGHDNQRLIDAIESDAELKAAWGHYSQIGDVIRASASGPMPDKNFAANISALIAQEPTILAPKKVNSLPSKRVSMATIGLAASLAMVAVIVGKSVNDHTEVFHTDSYAQAHSNQVAAKYGNQVENQADSQFNDYLVMHNESAYMAGSAAMLPYVRVVGSGYGR